MDYRPEIDGLRAIAVIPVMLFHAGFEVFSGGFVGVDVFFVISGYLITSLILTEKQAGTFSLVSFYERRARRILPALFMVMFVCLPFSWLWLLPADMKTFAQSVVAITTFTSNVLFWRRSGYFDTASELNPLLHTWSLAVEEQYYVLFPIFVMFTWKLGSRYIIGTLVLFFLVSLGAAQWGSIYKPFFAFFMLPARGWEILVGAFIAFYLKLDGNKKIKASQPVSQSASLIGLLLITYAVFFFNRQTPFPSLYTLIPTVGAAFVILFATPKTLAGKLLGSKLFVGIGLISYSAYLWHQPLIAFAKHRSVDKPSSLLLLALVLSTMLLAQLSLKYVEMPFRNRQRFKRNEVFFYAALCSICFVTVGFAGVLTSGFLYRYNAADSALAGLDMYQSGKYTDKRFVDNLDREFDQSNKKKILIIGDSYAKDLVNAIFESNLTVSIQISTHYISSVCGNLYLKRDFSYLIQTSNLASCNRTGWYENRSFQTRLKAADEIWLASKWSSSVAELLPESVDNLKSSFDKKVLIFGLKDFGIVNIKRLLEIPTPKRYEMRVSMNGEKIGINNLMLGNLAIDSFVNVAWLLCEDGYYCPLFSNDGKLLSYDGSHLTIDGANLLGRKLEEHLFGKRER